ncbi:MAG: translocation/assembly module TamB domain-containing protein [Halioglobus sp.]
MSKALKLVLATLALLLLLIAGGLTAIWTLVNSESGSAFVAGQLRHSMGDTLNWESIQGPLTGPLQLTGVSVSQPGSKLLIGRIRINWQPTALLQGKLLISSFAVDNIDIVLTMDDTSTSTEPFSPASLRLPVDVLLSGVRLANVQITQGTQPSLVIDSLQLDAKLQGHQLALERLEVHAPQGKLTVSGTASLEDDMPVDVHTNWTLADLESAPLEGELHLQGNVLWSEAIGFALDYDLSVQGLAQLEAGLPDEDRISGQATGSFSGDSIELGQLSLEAENHAMGLALQGLVSGLEGDTLILDTQVEWRNLHWPLDAETPDFTSAAGSLQVKGPLDGYQLELAAGLDGADIPSGQWQANGSGDLQQFKLAGMNAQILGGELSATGAVTWDPTPAWQLRIEGSELDPAQIAPELAGKLSLALNTSGQMDADRGLLAQVNIEQLSGQLLDYPLQLSAAGEVVGESLKLGNFTLSSGQNHLKARGELSATALALTWELRALSPGELLAGAAGAITGTGTIEGSTEAPLISARIKGTALALDTLSTSSLDLNLRAGTGADDVLMLEMQTGPLMDGVETLADSLMLKAQGSNSKHSAQLVLIAGEQELQTRLQGGLTAALDGWNGSLIALQASTEQFGQWALAKPAPLSLSAAAASLGNSCLHSESSPGKICVAGNWSASANSDVALTLQQIPLELLHASVTGDIQGKFNASLAASGALLASGAVDVSPGQFIVDLDQGSKQLAHNGGSLALNIDDKGLAAQLHFAPPENGTLDASVNLPALNSIPLNDHQPLTGRLQAALPDLAGIAAWVPDIATATGRMKADLTLAGTLEQPRILGELELLDGSADIPVAGLQLQQLELRMHSKPSQPDQLQVSGGVVSGPGKMTLTGLIDVTKASAALLLQGDRFEVYNTRDARVALSPDMQINWQNETLTLRGELVIPEAEITPKLELSPAMISQDDQEVSTPGQVVAPSADVVIINGKFDDSTSDTLSAPFRIDNQTTLMLGDAVNVNALGFVGRITGAVLFTNTPEQTELIPLAKGQFSVEDGTFRSFGQDLDIQTGQLLFNNVPATEPKINLRAVRWIDNDPQVSAAGITLTGPITTPTMELFSRPMLEASEVQAYLLTGRSTSDRNNVLSVGTYVSPRIYVGYGYNTLEKTSEFNSVFDITPRYGAGINVGEADNNLNMTFTYER